MMFRSLSATATSQSPGLSETLATAYNPGMCLWELPVICMSKNRMTGKYLGCYNRQNSLTIWNLGGYV